LEKQKFQTKSNSPLIELSTFESLVRQGKNLQPQNQGEWESQCKKKLGYLKKAVQEDLKEANHRYRLIEPYLGGN